MSAPTRGRAAGLSLVELMVALSIGLVLLAGAITVFGKTRDLQRTNEAAARLQESARYALAQIEADLRMANHYGLMSRPDLVDEAARPGETLDATLNPYAAVINACGNNWGVNLTAYVDGNNNGYGLTCAATGTAAPNADVLTVRRAGTELVTSALQYGATTGRFHVLSSRVQGSIPDPTATASMPAAYVDCVGPPLSCLTELRPLIVHSYYVGQDSDQRVGLPSLRRKQLDFAGGVPIVRDVEITSGVEGLQFVVGVDSNEDQNVDYYVNPNVAIPASDSIVAIRVWLLARAELPEVGFTDNRVYQYADRAAFTPNDGFRRLLVTKTITLRNTRR
jgi:type IV pilus assembly protein PilW